MENFLIRYNRRSGEAQVDMFDGADGRSTAIRERLRLEAALTDADWEIVVIAAESREDLQRTHARYFRRSGSDMSVVKHHLEALIAAGQPAQPSAG